MYFVDLVQQHSSCDLYHDWQHALKLCKLDEKLFRQNVKALTFTYLCVGDLQCTVVRRDCVTCILVLNNTL